jgi:hypothetical protein
VTVADLHRAELERLLMLERELARRRAADPLGAMSWLPAQVAYLASESKRKDLRAGNQGQGKTTVGAADAIWRALGRHPYRYVPPAPTSQWVLSPTERSSGICQRKLWELVPKEELASDSPRYDYRKGAFEGKYPKIMFRNGSWIEFRWGGGDVLNLASEKLHHAWIDEPPESERVFNEVQKRVLRTNGDISLTLTPVNRPVDWLRKRVEDGLIQDLHYVLSPEHLVFAAGPLAGRRMTLEDGTPCDAAWIGRLIAETSDQEVPVVIHGEWEFRQEGAYLAKVWRPDRMILETPPDLQYEVEIGIDFGDAPGKQIILDIRVADGAGAGGYPYVFVLSEYVGETGHETPEDDARGLLAMLARSRTSWSEVHSASADRVHKAGRPDKKSAQELQKAIAAELGLGNWKLLDPPVRVAKRGAGRGAGSLGTRSRWLHAQMARGNVAIHPRCTRLLEAIPKYSPWKDNDWKDPLDALVYGLDRYIYSGLRRGPAVATW